MSFTSVKKLISLFFRNLSDKGKVRKILSFPKGFTLVEIMTVLALLVLIFSLVERKMFSKGSRITDSFRFLAVLNRRLYTSAKLHNEVYRLVILLNNKKPEEVWVEKKLSEAKKHDATEENEPLLQKESSREYEKDPSFLKEPRKLTPLLSITSVESPYWKEIKTEGRVYLYYYPKGPGPEAAVHFKRQDNRAQWTLYFPPLQRELKLLKNTVSLQDIKAGI